MHFNEPFEFFNIKGIQQVYIFKSILFWSIRNETNIFTLKLIIIDHQYFIKKSIRKPLNFQNYPQKQHREVGTILLCSLHLIYCANITLVVYWIILLPASSKHYGSNQQRGTGSVNSTHPMSVCELLFLFPLVFVHKLINVCLSFWVKKILTAY